MMHNKRVVVMAALVALMFAGQVMAQTILLDKFELGKSTYDEVKSNLPKNVLLVRDDATPIDFYGGRTFSTDGTGYGVDGLRAVNFSFDKKQTLVALGMMLETRRLGDIKKALASKYQKVPARYPSSVMLFKSHKDFIQLFNRSGDVFAVEYVTGNIARKQGQSTQYVHPEDRKLGKVPGREVPADRAKF